MHGDLYRIAVHQSLNTLGLIAVRQLVGSVYIYLNFAAGSFLHQLAELASGLGPGAGFCGGAGVVPGLRFPAQIGMVFHIYSQGGSVGGEGIN